MHGTTHMIGWVGILVIFGMLVSSNSLLAQQGQRGPQVPDSVRVARMVENLDQAVTLTDEQKMKATEIYQGTMDAFRKLTQENTGDRRAMMQARRQLMQEQNDTIRAMLDKKQTKAFDKYLQEMRDRRNNRRR